MMKILNYISVEDLLAAIGNGETTVSKVTSKIKKNTGEESSNYVSSKKKSHYKDEIVGLEGMLYSFAKCCSPVPGEHIVGVVTKGKGVSVHRIDCPSLDTVPEERLMKISWRDGSDLNKTYVTSIRISCADKLGMLKDILIKAADCDTNITYANVKTSSTKKIGIIELGVEVNSIDKLNFVINAFQSLPDVHSVKRIQMNSKIKSDYPQKQKSGKHKKSK